MDSKLDKIIQLLNEINISLKEINSKSEGKPTPIENKIKNDVRSEIAKAKRDAARMVEQAKTKILNDMNISE